MTPEETIRRALESEASTVDVRPDALSTIRARTRRRRTRAAVRVWLGAGMAVAAAVALIFAVDRPGPAPLPGSPTSTPTASAGASPTVAAGPLVAVYWSHDDRLVREFHRAAAADTPTDRVRAALALMFGTAPLDPDYTSAWPAGTAVRDVTVAGDVVTVDLGGATSPSALATQQLVWTVTAASTLPEVRIGAGGPVLRRAPAIDTLAPVWLINPQHDDVVRGGRVEVHVAGFAATARLDITPAVAGYPRDLTLAGGSPAQREAQLTLTVPPGRYTLTVTVAGGASDDHIVVVE
ncbi:GerMN domain-containing protein [Asanoa siamensis]|uniref:GerMN domain-containing protein n=1 Tax=Asanoa siamensis TaxID=926357 RepID=A0ABQ4CJC9_9ACTN|nr:GerMN domain-containing protein [Asanoa siamensis]GIF71402.1 hypothetical protein Asi02nite_09200 [Asanoa siamensis]